MNDEDRKNWRTIEAVTRSFADQLWAELRGHINDMNRIVKNGAYTPADQEIVRKALAVVAAELFLNGAAS